MEVITDEVISTAKAMSFINNVRQPIVNASESEETLLTIHGVPFKFVEEFTNADDYVVESVETKELYILDLFRSLDCVATGTWKISLLNENDDPIFIWEYNEDDDKWEYNEDDDKWEYNEDDDKSGKLTIKIDSSNFPITSNK